MILNVSFGLEYVYTYHIYNAYYFVDCSSGWIFKNFTYLFFRNNLFFSHFTRQSHSHSLPVSCSLHLSPQPTPDFYNTLEVNSRSSIVHLCHTEGEKNKSISVGSSLSSVNSDLNSLLLLHAPWVFGSLLPEFQSVPTCFVKLFVPMSMYGYSYVCLSVV